MYEIESIGEMVLHAGSAHPHVETVFTLVVFAPKPGQVLNGKVKFIKEHGATLSLGFFDTVYLPATQMQPGTYLYVPVSVLR